MEMTVSSGKVWPDTAETGFSTVASYFRPLHAECVLLGLRQPLPPRCHPAPFYLYAASLLTAMSISSLYNIVDTVEEFYDSFEALLIFVFSMAFVFLAALGSDTLQRALREIHQVDLALQTVGLHFRYERREMLTRMSWRCLLVLGVCTFDAYSYTIIPWTSDGVTNIFSYYYFYFLFDCVQLQYTSLAVTVARHFQLINTRVSDHWTWLRTTDHELQVLLNCHRDLGDVCDHLGDFYSRQLFIVSSFVFCNNTSHAYCMISTLNYIAVGGQPAAGEEDIGPRWCIFALRGVFISFRVLELVWVIRATTYLEDQASKSCHIIAQKVVLDRTSIRNEFLELHMAAKSKVDIWACGCFKMDNALILTATNPQNGDNITEGIDGSMLSAASTYIMILVQYAPERQPEFGKTHEHPGNLTAA